MKKILSVLLVVVMSIGLVCGCSTTVGGDSTDSDAPAGEIDFSAGYDYTDTITVWINNQDSEVRILEAFISAFNQVYPNITVNYQKLDTLTDQLIYNSQLDTMCDVFWVTPEFISRYKEYDIISPLSSFVEADPNFDLSNLNRDCVRSCSDNGVLYVMPRDYNQVVMYYNVDMFDAAGVAYPAADKAMSQTEFVKMLADLKTGLLASDEKNSYGVKYSEGFTSSMDASILWDSLSWPIVKSFGGQFFDENGKYLDDDGNMLFDCEGTREAMRFAYDLVKNKYMGNPNVWKARDGAQFFLETAPVYLHCRAMLSAITNKTNTYHGISNLGVAPCPDFGDSDTYYVGSGATGYSMFSGSKHKTAAWLFLKFLVSERAQEEASKTGNHVPVISSLIDDANAEWRKYTTSAFGSHFSHDPFVYRMDKCFTHVREIMEYVKPSYQFTVFERLQNCYTDCISNVTTSPDKQIPEFVKKYAKDIKTYIEAA